LISFQNRTIVLFCTIFSLPAKMRFKIKRMDITRILAIRHGETAWNVDTRIRQPEWTPQGGGESLVMLQERITHLVHELASPHTGQQVLWVTHGGVLDILYRLATGQDLQAPRTWGLRNTAVNRLIWTPQGLQMVGWADEAHLDLAKDESSA